MDRSIFVLSVDGWYFSFYSNFNKTFSKQAAIDPDQTLNAATSDLGLHCLPITKRKLGLYGLNTFHKLSTLHFLKNMPTILKTESDSDEELKQDYDSLFFFSFLRLFSFKGGCKIAGHVTVCMPGFKPNHGL